MPRPVQIVFAISVALVGATLSFGQQVSDQNICGPLALAAMAQYLGRSDLVDKVFELLPASGEPRTLQELEITAVRLGFHCRAIRWRPDVKLDLNTPAIIRLKPSEGRDVGHYILLLAVNDDRVLTLDPLKNVKWVNRKVLSRAWNGVALYVSPSPTGLPRAELRQHSRLVGALLVALGVGALILLHRSYHYVRHSDYDRLAASKYFRGRVIGGVLGGCTVAIVAALWWASLTERGSRSSGIVADPEYQAFYVPAEFVSKEFTARGSYTICNNGDTAARIARIETSCGCAQPQLSAATVPAHGTVTASVAVKAPKTRVSNFRITVMFDDTRLEQVVLAGTIIRETSSAVGVNGGP